MKNLTRGKKAMLILPFSLCIIIPLLFFLVPGERMVIEVNVSMPVSCAEDTVFTSMNTIEMCGKFRLRYPRSSYPLNVTAISASFGAIYVRSFAAGTGGVLWVGEIPAALMNVSEPLQVIASSALNSTDNATVWHTLPDIYDDFYGNPTLFYDVERGSYRELLEIKQCEKGTLLYLAYIPVTEYESLSLDFMDSIASIKCM